MTDESQLSDLLSEFARTLLTDFSIQAILDHLVGRIVETLSITGAGVTLISPNTHPHYVAASNNDALTFERIQTELGEGPCRLAYETGEAVLSPDLGVETRFPRFTKAARAGGLVASFAYPLRHNDGRLGALDLYRDTAGALSESDMTAAQTLADVAAAYILNAQAREDARIASDRFREGALRDPLTGLANRVLLQQRLEHAARRAERTHTSAAVLFADLDKFKQINDDHGHKTGDDLLVTVARRLSKLLRPGDTLARVSGDEFVFLCENLAQESDVEVLADRIDSAFDAPFVIDGKNLAVTASIGMAFAGPGEAVSNQLVIDADIAMYQAKRKGGARHQIIDVREADQTFERHGLERDLRKAVEAHQLDVHYQPIVRSTDGLVTGVEALLRWTHPDRGPIATTDVVGIAEDNGLIVEIGAWILERACTDRQRWRHDHPHTVLDLAVNVSGRQLLAPGFALTVEEVLTSTGIDPGALTLEMTESIFIDEASRVLTVLADLKSLGVRLALDDFGTGYCSLNYLNEFPIDIVKIDRTFVHSIDNGPTAAAIVEAVTNLAHVLGLTVIAEGVETPEQSDEINEVGCDAAQGFFYARPMDNPALVALLNSHPSHNLYLPATRPATVS